MQRTEERIQNGVTSHTNFPVVVAACGISIRKGRPAPPPEGPGPVAPVGADIPNYGFVLNLRQNGQKEPDFDHGRLVDTKVTEREMPGTKPFGRPGLERVADWLAGPAI